MVWACPNASSRGAELRLIVTALGAALLLSACATTPSQLASTRTTTGGPQGAAEGANPANGARYKLGAPYQAGGLWYVPAEQPAYDEVGVASWYGDDFNGKATSNGERFDMYGISAAHATLPMPSIVEVTNLENGKTLRVRLNDRGPYKAGRIIDLSRSAAQQLGYMDKGTAKVRVRYVGPAKLDGSTEPLFIANAGPAKPLQQLASLQAADTPVAVRTVWNHEAPGPAISPPPAATAPRPVSTPMRPPTAAPPAPQAQAAAIAGDGFSVQAGAFSDRAKAQRIADALGAAGTVSVKPVPDRALYRVVVGPWRDAAQAQAARAQVVALGYADARVIKAF